MKKINSLNGYLTKNKTYLLFLLNILLIIFIIFEVSILYNLTGGIGGVESEKKRDICVGDLC